MADLLAKPAQNQQGAAVGKYGGRDLLAPQQPQEEQTSWLQRNIVRPIAKLPLGLTATVGRQISASKALLGGAGMDEYKRIQSAPVDYGYFGKNIEPWKSPIKEGGIFKPGTTELQNPIDPREGLKTVGRGLEAASYIPLVKSAVTPFQAGAKLLGKQAVPGLAKQAMKETVLEGAVGGGWQGGGSYLQDAEKPSALGFAGNTALGAAAGGAIAGTLGGALIGLGAARQAILPENLIQGVANRVYSILRPSAKMLSLEDKYSKDSSMFIAKFMTERKMNEFGRDAAGRLDPSEVISSMTDEQSRAGEVLSQYLKQHYGQISLNEFRDRALAALDSDWNRAKGSDFTKMQKTVAKEIDALKANYRQPGNVRGDDVLISLHDFNRIKQGFWTRAKGWMTADDKIFSDVNFEMGHTAKGMLEAAVPDADIRAYNKYLGDLATAIQLLEKRRGFTLPGGWLRRYAARIVGSVAGSRMGPVGSIVGAMSADRIEQAIMRPSVSNSFINSLLEKAGPSVIEELEKKLGAPIQEVLQKRVSGVAGDITRPGESLTGLPSGILDLRKKPAMPSGYGAALEQVAQDPAAVSSGPIDALLHEARTPQGRAFVRNYVQENVGKNADGTIKAYRVGSTASGKALVTTDRALAQELAAERIRGGLDGTISELSVHPSQIEAVVPGQNPELIVGEVPSPTGLPVGRTFHPQKEQPESGIINAFNASKDQVEVGNFGPARFEIGSFIREKSSGKLAKGTLRGGVTRLGIKEMPSTIPHITEAYRSQPPTHPYANENIVWIAKMPSGEIRAFITRQNARGAEELMNTPWVVNGKWLDNIRKNGPAEAYRTGIGIETAAPAQAGEPLFDIRRQQGGGGAQRVPPVVGGVDVPVVAEEPKKLVGFTSKVRLPFFDKLVSEGRAVMGKQELLDMLRSAKGKTQKVELDMIESVVNSMDGRRLSVQDVIDKIESERLVVPIRKHQFTKKPRGTPFDKEHIGDPEHLSLTLGRRGGFGDIVEDQGVSLYQAPFKTRSGHFSGEDSLGDSHWGHVRWSWLKKGDIDVVPTKRDTLLGADVAAGEPIKIPGKDIVQWDEFQTDIDQAKGGSLDTLLAKARAELDKVRTVTSDFDSTFDRLKSGQVKSARQAAFNTLINTIDNQFGYTTRRKLEGSTVPISRLSEKAQSYAVERGLDELKVSDIIELGSGEDVPLETFRGDLETVLGNAWRELKAHLQKSVAPRYNPPKTFAEITKRLRQYDDATTAMSALNTYAEELGSAAAAPQFDPRDPEIVFGSSAYRNIIDSIVGAQERVAAVYDSPEVREVYKNAWNWVEERPKVRVAELERMNVMSGRVMEYQIRDQLQMMAEAGKKYGLIPTGKTSQTIEGHSHSPFYAYERIKPADVPIARRAISTGLTQFGPANVNAQPAVMVGESGAFIHTGGKLEEFGNLFQGEVPQYIRMDSEPMRELFTSLGTTYRETTQSYTNDINRALAGNDIQIRLGDFSEVPDLFRNPAFINGAIDESTKREIVMCVRDVFEAVFGEQNRAEVTPIISRLVPETDFAVYGSGRSGSLVSVKKKDLLAEDTITEAKNLFMKMKGAVKHTPAGPTQDVAARYRDLLLSGVSEVERETYENALDDIIKNGEDAASYYSARRVRNLIETKKKDILKAALSDEKVRKDFLEFAEKGTSLDIDNLSSAVMEFVEKSVDDVGDVALETVSAAASAMQSATHNVKTTMAMYNKYSNEIPKYFEKITGEKAVPVTVKGHTFNLVKIPPPSKLPISQFAIFPYLFMGQLGKLLGIDGDSSEGSSQGPEYGPKELPREFDEATKEDLAALIYSEAGGKTYAEIEQQAREIFKTIMVRTRDTKQGPRDVMSTPRQYDGYGSARYQEYKAGPKNLMDARKAQIIRRVVDEMSARPTAEGDLDSFNHLDGFEVWPQGNIRKNPKPTSTPYPYF